MTEHNDLIERAKALALAVETGAPDFIGDPHPDRYVTCFYRNPDGPELFGIVEALQARVVELRRAGEELATIAFNMAQREHLTDDERQALGRARKQWDAAALATMSYPDWRGV